MTNSAAIKISDLIDANREHWVLASTAQLLVNLPSAEAALVALSADEESANVLMRSDGSGYRTAPYVPMLRRKRQDMGEFNLAYMRITFTGYVSSVGDALSNSDYFDHHPVLMFFRHVRNAVSHGNRFNFLHGEPREPAQFRTLMLRRADHGTELFFGYLSPGELFDLFDDVQTHLRALT